MLESVELLSFGLSSTDFQEISVKPYDKKLICSIRGQQSGVRLQRRRHGIRGGPVLTLRYRLCAEQNYTQIVD